MMKIQNVDLPEDQLCATLKPVLLGRVFHATTQEISERILADGRIRANTSGERSSPFGSTNSFFRKRGCVCFFDYRSASLEERDIAIGKCSPYRLPSRNPELQYESHIAFLFLAKSAHERLVPWSEWEEEEAYNNQIVPRVEAGYPGDVPITLVEGMLRVTIDYQSDSIAAILHRTRFSRRSRT